MTTTSTGTPFDWYDKPGNGGGHWSAVPEVGAFGAVFVFVCLVTVLARRRGGK